MSKPFVAAVVQTAAVAFDPVRTVEKMSDYAVRAALRGAKLVVFPEAFVGGYPKGLDFGVKVGMRTPAGREQFRLYYDGAIDVPVTGVSEREAGTLYCTVLFFSPDGRLVARHRKLMPTAAERVIWGFGDGSTMPVIDTSLGKVGAVICWENYMPMLRMAMYAKGIELYCAPTADDRETWTSTMRHVALEGRCFVLSACQVARRSDYPADYPIEGDPAPDTILMRGGSCIIGPLGQVLVPPAFDVDTILTAEIDLLDIARGKFDFDVTGHYARPDVFRLQVDERPQQAVQTVGPAVAVTGGRG